MPDIKLIQKKINELNFTTTLKIDGDKGPKTDSAIMKLQILLRIEISDIEDIPPLIDRVIEKKEYNTIQTGYLTQRVNYKYSWRMCNISCLLMLKNYYNKSFTSEGYIKGKKQAQLEIEAMDKLIDSDPELKAWAEKRKLHYFINNQKLEQISKILAMVLTRDTDYEFDIQYLDMNAILKKLDEGHPLIISTRFPGRKTSNKKSGHYVNIVGYFGDLFIINDSWGLWENYYQKTDDILTKGENVLIHKDDLFGEWGAKTEKDDKAFSLRANYYRTITTI